MTAQRGTAARTISIQFRPRYNEQGEHMLWMVSWVTGDHGEEGEWFYSGTGGDVVEKVPPPGVRGIRIRRWPSNGLDPEYVDLQMGDIDDTVTDRGLRFDRKQPFSRLLLEDD